MAIVRVICHKPVMVFLDEATSQIDNSSEETVYRLLKQYNISYVSIGHRDSIRTYHQVQITLKTDGSYVISNIV